MTFYIW